MIRRLILAAVATDPETLPNVASVPLPGITVTEVSLLVTAVGTLLIGMLSWRVNKRGATESVAQRQVANELQRRSQSYDEMKALTQERGAALAAERLENQRLREENRLLRDLTRAQVMLSETRDIIPGRIID